jgi:C4-dicarboxylate transporter DctQ subunit
MKNAAKTVLSIIDAGENILLVLSMSIFALGVVIDVVCRKLFGFNLYFLQELGKYLMVFATFVGASIGVKKRAHPNMSAIIDAVPPAIRFVMLILVNLICAAAMAFAGYWSWQQYLNFHKLKTMTSTLGSIPVSILYIIVPITLFVMTARFLIQAYVQPKEEMDKMKLKKRSEEA